MVDLNERVLDEAEDRRRQLLPEELVGLIERHHTNEQPGVPAETLEAYAAALSDELEGQFDADSFLGVLDEQITDAETWQGNDALYALGDDRVSAYPADWHEQLGGSNDVREFIRFLQDDADDFEDLESGGAGDGIPEDTLLDIVAVVGGTDRETAKARLEDLRDSGEVAEDADQHPDARVRLTE